MAEERKRTERLMGEVAERRNRDDDNFDLSGSMNMVIPDEIKAQLKAEGWTPRWVNDLKGRVQRLTTKDDFAKVPNVEPVRVGTNDDGEPIFAHLLAKPDAFIRADQLRADVRRREIEQAAVTGSVPTKAGADPAPVQGHLGAETYVPEGNAIKRDNRILE